MTVTLPLVELEEGKKPWTVESYEKSGSYFVKDSQGIYHIVYVDVASGTCSECMMPPEVGNMLACQEMQDGLKQKLDSMTEAFDRIRAVMEESVLNLESGLGSKIGEEIAKVLHMNDMIMQEVESIKEASVKEDTPAYSKGFVSEDAILEIIKNVRK